MFLNILVAVDGSPDADEALSQAIDLAASEHSRPVIICRYHTPREDDAVLWAVIVSSSEAVVMEEPFSGVSGQ